MENYKVLSENYQIQKLNFVKRRNESRIPLTSGTSQRSPHQFRGDLYSGADSVLHFVKENSSGVVFMEFYV